MCTEFHTQCSAGVDDWLRVRTATYDDDDEGGQLRVVQEVVGAEDHGDVQERSFDLEKVVPKCKKKSTRNSRLKL